MFNTCWKFWLTYVKKLHLSSRMFTVVQKYWLLAKSTKSKHIEMIKLTANKQNFEKFEFIKKLKHYTKQG